MANTIRLKSTFAVSLQSYNGEVDGMPIATPREFFESVVPEKFDPNKAVDIDCVVQMNITGDKGGSWNITIKNQKIEVKEGVHPSPTLTVKMKDDDYLDMINGKLSGERAFLTGKLKFKGDLATAMKIRNVGIL